MCLQFRYFCWHEWNTLFLHINFWDKGTQNIQYKTEIKKEPRLVSDVKSLGWSWWKMAFLADGWLASSGSCACPCLILPPVFWSLISSCSSIQRSLCPRHRCIYFCGTSLKHGITTDYLIPLALTHSVCGPLQTPTDMHVCLRYAWCKHLWLGLI